MAVVTPIMLLLACSLSLGAQSLGGASPADRSEPNPAPVLSVRERAELYLARKQYTDAIELVQQAIRSGDRRAEYYNLMGIAAEQTQQLRLAENAYKQAIKRDRQKAEYYNNLGTVYYSEHKWGKALKWYKKAIHHRQIVSSFYVNAGMAEFARRHFANATKYFRKALLIDPNALFPNSNGGTVVQDLDHKDPALFHFDLARLFCSLGNSEDCMHQFRMAVELHYKKIKNVYTDAAFAPLRNRPDFAAIMQSPN